MSKFVIFPRIRKKSEDPKKFIRLHRAEFAHDYNKKSFIKNNYYPDAEVLINEIAKFYKKERKYPDRIRRGVTYKRYNYLASTKIQN